MVKKAVILAGGKGTRMLPYTKACAKEMLPLCDKPAVHYIVQEAADAGATDVLIIVSPGKTDIIRYFAKDAALDKELARQNKSYMLDELNALISRTNITFATQYDADGTGGALLIAEKFAEGNPLLVMNGDDLMKGNGENVSAQLVGCFDRHGKAVVAVSRVDDEELKKCGSVRVVNTRGRELEINAIMEKPKDGEAYGNFATQGRYVLPFSIFEYLKKTPMVGEEVRLTDAIGSLAADVGAYAYDFDGVRYDLGSKTGYFKAVVDYAKNDPEISVAVKKILSTYGGKK